MLFMALAAMASHHGRRISWRDLASHTAQVSDATLPEAAATALQAHGFTVRVFTCTQLADLIELPVVLRLKDKSWVLLTTVNATHATFHRYHALPNSAASDQLASSSQILISHDELQESHDGLVVYARRSSSAAVNADAYSATTNHWFWGVFEKLRAHYGDCAVAAILINVLGLAASMFSMNVYDRIIPNAAMHSLWTLGIGVLLAAIMELGLRSLRAHVLDDAGKRADLVISSAIYRQTLALRPDQRPSSSGQWAGQLREFESVRDFVSSSTLVALTDLPFVLIFFAVLVWMGGNLVWIPVFAALLIIALGVVTQWPIRRSVEQYQYETTQKHAFLIESIERLETIEALGAEPVFQGRWERLCASAARSGLISRGAASFTLNGSQWIQQTASTVLIVAGVYFILAGQLTVGTLIGCSILAGRALSPLAQVAGLMARWHQTRTAFQTVDKLMQLPAKRDPLRDIVSLAQWQGQLELHNIEFTFPKTNNRVLSIPSLRLKRGEVVAIMGPVGSGKSTLLRLLAGLQPPSYGQVMIDQLDLQQLSPSDWRAQVAWISQDPVLFRGTLRENLLLGNPRVTDEHLVHLLSLTGLGLLVQQHPQGLDMPLGESGQALSGGQRQLVALARAILSEASIWLFDEPTSAMDMAGEQALLQRLKPAFKNKLVVFVTHRPGPLEVVDRLILLDKGHLVADGPRDDVLKAVQQGQISRVQSAPKAAANQHVLAGDLA
jgi:ATP-binding cassette subfamily C protein LapB